MKNLVKYIVIAGAVLGSTKAMGADKWYTSAFGGVNYEESSSNLVKMDPGFIAGVTAGRELSPHVRCEGELSYRENHGEADIGGYLDYSESHRQANAMVNGILDILPGNFVNPYVGFGLGGSYSEDEQKGVSYHESLSSFSEIASSWDASGQEIVGFRISPMKNADIGAEYRHTHLLSFKRPSNSLAANFKFRF